MDASFKPMLIFFLVTGVALVGYATLLFENNDVTGAFSFGKSRYISTPYYPPTYTAPRPVAAPAPVPQISPVQWAMSTIQNIVANTQNYESCTSTCKPTVLNLCMNNKIGGGNTEFCTSLANSYEYVCSGTCRTKFPATPQQAPRQNPDVWANQLIQSYVKVQKDVSFCKNNCFQTVQGNCIGQRILSDATACAQFGAKYVNGCQGACQIEFSQREQKAAIAQPQIPQPPAQQTPAMQYAECAKKCVQSRARSETECFAQQPPTATVEEKQKTCEMPVTLIYNNCMDKTGCLALYRALQTPPSQ